MRIREMRVGDAEALAGLWHEMAAYHAKCDPYWRLKRNCKGGYADYMREILGAPDKVVYVAHDGGRIVGFALAVIDKRARVFAQCRNGLIQDLAVTAKWRRRGIGRRLVRKCWEWFKGRAVRTVEVRAATANPLATAFWRRMGFEEYMAMCRKRV